MKGHAIYIYYILVNELTPLIDVCLIKKYK